jgi:hypothetical protein
MSFTLFAGNARKLIVSVVNDDTGEPEDLTDVELFWQASRGTTAKFSSVPVLTKTIGNGITVIDAINGELEIMLDADDTENLNGTYYHELLLIDVTGDQQNLLADTFTVKRRLAKPVPSVPFG